MAWATAASAEGAAERDPGSHTTPQARGSAGAVFYVFFFVPLSPHLLRIFEQIVCVVPRGHLLTVSACRASISFLPLLSHARALPLKLARANVCCGVPFPLVGKLSWVHSEHAHSQPPDEQALALEAVLPAALRLALSMLIASRRALRHNTDDTSKLFRCLPGVRLQTRNAAQAVMGCRAGCHVPTGAA